jgi:hypothetical protein|tara:strand:+ start:104 stop:574 length:471 start_codon:yes stop_codon:yes gene_type:complete
MTEAELKNQLYTQAGLVREDLYDDPRGFKVIKRNGIEKIQAHYNVSVTFDLHEDIVQNEGRMMQFIRVKATGKLGNRTIETYGEASPMNCVNKYPIATAEKRALSRAVLKLTGLYKYGFFGQDEIIEEKDENKLVNNLKNVLPKRTVQTSVAKKKA